LGAFLLGFLARCRAFVALFFAWFVIWGLHRGNFADMRVPDLTEAECKIRAKEFAAPRLGAGYCVIEGRPEPVWRPATKRRPSTCVRELWHGPDARAQAGVTGSRHSC
jgi:hypothetical protein